MTENQNEEKFAESGVEVSFIPSSIKSDPTFQTEYKEQEVWSPVICQKCKKDLSIEFNNKRVVNWPLIKECDENYCPSKQTMCPDSFKYEQHVMYIVTNINNEGDVQFVTSKSISKYMSNNIKDAYLTIGKLNKVDLEFQLKPNIPGVFKVVPLIYTETLNDMRHYFNVQLSYLKDKNYIEIRNLPRWKSEDPFFKLIPLQFPVQ